jgi:hypothetical protein
MTANFFLSVAVIVGEKLGLRAKADDAGRCHGCRS